VHFLFGFIADQGCKTVMQTTMAQHWRPLGGRVGLSRSNPYRKVVPYSTQESHWKHANRHAVASYSDIDLSGRRAILPVASRRRRGAKGTKRRPRTESRSELAHHVCPDGGIKLASPMFIARDLLANSPIQRPLHHLPLPLSFLFFFFALAATAAAAAASALSFASCSAFSFMRSASVMI